MRPSNAGIYFKLAKTKVPEGEADVYKVTEETARHKNPDFYRFVNIMTDAGVERKEAAGDMQGNLWLKLS